MTYDKKTKTINIGASDTPEDFSRDMSKFFEDVDRQLADDQSLTQEQRADFKKEYERTAKINKAFDDYAKLSAISEASKTVKNLRQRQEVLKKQTIREKISSLSRISRTFIVLISFWFAFVIFRTTGDYELFGLYFEQWRTSNFFSNLLVLPIIVFVMFKAIQWINRK